MTYISVRNWRKFQHYDPAKRVPPWIKNHTELMSSDEYLSLSSARRGVLHGLWMEYAAARCALRLDTAELSRRLNVRVTKQTLEALNHAGFIDFVASKTLADGYQDASALLALARSREVETEKERPRSSVVRKPDNGRAYLCTDCAGLAFKTKARLLEHRENVHADYTATATPPHSIPF